MRTIIISGTSRGIGSYLSNHYLAKGFYVVGCSRNIVTVDNPNYKHYCLEISDENQVSQMVKQVRKEKQGIYGLINNAGIASMNHTILSPMKTVERIFGTNFFGTFCLSREVAKSMIKQRLGRIINFSTIAVPLNLEGESIYASSKTAIESFTRILAKELGQYNITVNALGPTPIRTDLIKSVPDEKIQKIIQNQAIKRYGEFEDVANVTDFFLKEESSFITGQTVYLGGIS